MSFGKSCFYWSGNILVKFWNNLGKKFLLGKFGMVFVSISFFKKILAGKILLLGMLGIFLENVTWENLFRILVKFWNCYLEKILFGNMGGLFESIILGKLGKSWENSIWENFIWENWEYIIWENCVAHVCWTKSWKNVIWKILNILLGKFYLGKFGKYYSGKFCCPYSFWQVIKFY